MKKFSFKQLISSKDKRQRLLPSDKLKRTKSEYSSLAL